MKKYIASLSALLMCLSGMAQEMGSVLIKNGTVLTITDGIKNNTDVWIKNGKIKEIGQNLSADRSTEIVDAKGKFVMPGIIDAHSHIALETVNESTNPITSEVFVGDGLDPQDVAIYRALAGGVTISHAMHGSANAVGGECETIKHRYGTWDPDDLRMQGAPRTIKFALGENPMRVHGEGRNITPSTRMGIEQVFRKAFAEGRIYKKEWDDFNSGKTKTPPVYSRRMETIRDILDGEIIIHCHSYRADEILMLMNVLSDFGVDKICFQHVNEGFKVAPELAEFGAGASVFSDWWAYKFEVYYSTAYNAAILARNGVITSINSDSGELIRHLYHEAAKTQRYGDLTDNEALRLITINPAIQLGIDERVGSLEVGKDGDVAIFSGHPLSIYSIPEITIVDGIIRFDIENDPDDMRIDIDPEEKFNDSYIELDAEDEDRCMQDVFHELFFGALGKSHTLHKH
ncbi:MAG: amidohydrolase family protein [Bacteroidota bacterium]